MPMRLSLGKYVSYLIGIAVSLVLFSIILLAFGFNPITSMEVLVTGSFGSVYLRYRNFCADGTPTPCCSRFSRGIPREVL